MKSRRDRLSIQPIGNALTYSNYIGMVFEEPVILHKVAQQHQFFHWSEHLNSFLDFAANKPPSYQVRNSFDILKKLIVEGLEKCGYRTQGNEIQSCKTEEELNKLTIRQYTEETGLYHEVNSLLRECHNYENNQGPYDTPLAPWMLQLNSSIRKEKTFEGKAFRGTFLSQKGIDLYKKGTLFVWASFVSASKSEEACFGGNVIFEIFTESAMSLNDKRFARDISHLSVLPEEQEVLFPIACAYRVHYIKKTEEITRIGIATVDYN